MRPREKGLSMAFWPLTYDLRFIMGHLGCDCSSTVDKVCGFDGREYASGCHADCEGMKIDCKGACPCKSGNNR